LKQVTKITPAKTIQAAVNDKICHGLSKVLWNFVGAGVGTMHGSLPLKQPGVHSLLHLYPPMLKEEGQLKTYGVQVVLASVAETQHALSIGTQHPLGPLKHW
jgi:hypothetical protein